LIIWVFGRLRSSPSVETGRVCVPRGARACTHNRSEDVVPIVDLLAQYPNIAALQRASGKTLGAMTASCEHGAVWLPRLNLALSRLDMRARPSLRGLGDDLFSEKSTRLLAAVAELLAFDWLKQKDLLSERDIGFPADWSGGDDPPFEGALNSAGRLIPFDVK
jgi:hypothetical protein